MPRKTLIYVAVLVALAIQASITFAQLPTANKIVCVTAIDHHAWDDRRYDGRRERNIEEMRNAGISFRRLIEDAANAGGVPHRFEDIDPNRVTRNSILNTIRRTRVDGDTTLVVFCNCHGGTDPMRGSFLGPVTSSDVLRSEILDASLNRRQRPMLLVLITNCCSDQAVAMVAPTGANPERERMLRNLFLQHRGVVDVTAATYHPEHTRGELAYGHIFTRGLVDATTSAGASGEPVDTDGDGFISWGEFMPHVQTATNELFQMEISSSNQNQQIPQAFCLGRRSDVTTFSQNRRFRVGLSVWPDGDGGLVVRGVEANTPATDIIELNGRRAGSGAHFVVGDHIDRVNGQRVPSLDALYSVLDGVPRGGTVRMTGRDGNSGDQYSAIIRLD